MVSFICRSHKLHFRFCVLSLNWVIVLWCKTIPGLTWSQLSTAKARTAPKTTINNFMCLTVYLKTIWNIIKVRLVFPGTIPTTHTTLGSGEFVMRRIGWGKLRRDDEGWHCNNVVQYGHVNIDMSVLINCNSTHTFMASNDCYSALTRSPDNTDCPQHYWVSTMLVGQVSFHCTIRVRRGATFINKCELW